jgi:antitoxin component of MazEF toxin-antitoxin module
MENTMANTLVPHGEDLAIVIDRKMLQEWNINEDTPLEVAFDGEVLMIKPLREGDQDERFQQALERTNQKYARGLRRLAE